MKKDLTKGRDIYAISERNYTDKEVDQFFYSIFFYGNIVLGGMTSDDVREVINCLQNALDVNEKGGQK